MRDQAQFSAKRHNSVQRDTIQRKEKEIIKNIDHNEDENDYVLLFVLNCFDNWYETRVILSHRNEVVYVIRFDEHFVAKY